MNVNKSRAGVFLVVVALLALTACGGGSDKSEPAAPASEEAPVAATAVQPTEPPASGGEEPASGGEEPVAATEAPPEPTAVPGPEIPFDIAIIDGAVDLEIQETMITYHLEEFQIEDAAEFYKNFMAEQGWNSLTDSMIGVMATLVFESDEARVSIKLQANTFAETVEVQILVFYK